MTKRPPFRRFLFWALYVGLIQLAVLASLWSFDRSSTDPTHGNVWLTVALLTFFLAVLTDPIVWSGLRGRPLGR